MVVAVDMRGNTVHGTILQSGGRSGQTSLESIHYAKANVKKKAGLKLQQFVTMLSHIEAIGKSSLLDRSNRFVTTATTQLSKGLRMDHRLVMRMETLLIQGIIGTKKCHRWGGMLRFKSRTKKTAPRSSNF